MSKSKRSSHGKARGGHKGPPPGGTIGGPLDPRRQGLTAFRSGRFDAAIAAWTAPARNDPRVAAALAEAYFRRALTRTVPAEQVADLRQAVTLVPADLPYHYHLGLALHRDGRPVDAMAEYRTVLGRDPRWPGVAFVLALAALEQDATIDLTALPGSTPSIQAALAPVQALLRGQRGAPADDALNRLWQGLQALAQPTGAAEALTLLDDTRPLSTAQATVTRRYYRGVALARAGDHAGALGAWRNVSAERFARPWLEHNIAAALQRDGGALLAPDDLVGTSPEAQRLRGLATRDASFAARVVRQLDTLARDAATAGEWARAVAAWEQAREFVGLHASLGSPRPLLHNLALAYEALDLWSEAAEAWRALLRTRPRRTRRVDADATQAVTPTAAPAGSLTEEQWAWVRARVIACYKKAGQPGEAVGLFRQAIKADPDDLDTRLQLVDALLANQQDQAASNELERILAIDPQHVEARLRQAALDVEQGYLIRAMATFRDVLAREPGRDDVRRTLAQTLLTYGDYLLEQGDFARAAAAFTEGADLEPASYRFPLRLARLAIDRAHPAEAVPHLSRALELATTDRAAYVAIIECWAVAGNLDEARAVLSVAAERLGAEDPDFYIDAAEVVFAQAGRLAASAPPARSRGARGTRAKGKAGQPPPPAEAAWSALGQELLDRAVAVRPDDALIPSTIASAFITTRPDLALRYAEEAARLDPHNPEALITLGLAQGLNDHGREAEQTLRRAARLARQQGRPELVREAEELAGRIASPFFRVMAGLMLGGPDALDSLDGLGGLDGLDDIDPADIFF